MEKEVYLSYDPDDQDLVRTIRYKIEDKKEDIFFLDYPSKPLFSLESSLIVKEKIRKMIESSQIVLCMLGYSTNLNKWVTWEANTAVYLEKKLIGVRLHDIYLDQIPKPLQDHHSKIISCELKTIIQEIL